MGRAAIRSLAVLTVLINGAGTADPISGDAELSGTFECNQRSVLFANGQVRQKHGDFVARGTFRVSKVCTDSGTWTATVGRETSPFSPGAAKVEWCVFGTTGFEGRARPSRVRP